MNQVGIRDSEGEGERGGREIKNEIDFVLFVQFPFSKLVLFPVLSWVEHLYTCSKFWPAWLFLKVMGYIFLPLNVFVSISERFFAHLAP